MYTVLITSSLAFAASFAAVCRVLYCPAGVNKRLPSGANVKRLKNDVSVSLAYMLVFRMPLPKSGLGDAGGITAGKGSEGAGDADRRMDGEEAAPKDDRRLWEMCDGGFIGRAMDCGVPGADGPGDPGACITASKGWSDRWPKSGGAGLLDEGRRAGRSIFDMRPCCAKEN